MAEKSDGGQGWRELDDEERTRHNTLFFSQAPIEGLLPGERARELFLRSNLPLPILSQVWNLVDVPHDNMLDPAEFAAAMHLLQWYLQGRRLPRHLPAVLQPSPQEEIRPPAITFQEMSAYRKLFDVLDDNNRSYIDAMTARDILVTSSLPLVQLSKVWNLADFDRDGRLSPDEFSIACHITRYLRKEGKIDGPVNVQSLLPHKTPKYDLQAKRRRLAEVYARKPKLMALREKRKSEAARESRRACIHREKLRILQLKHAVLSEDGRISPRTMAIMEEELQQENDQVVRMATIADRLKREHERVRQETARVIMDEQRLTQEIKLLEEEADKQRKKRQRNSLIKDLDPFHQLHEERKEERMKGVHTKKEPPAIEIPFKVDPFDKAKLSQKPLSGHELFGVKDQKNDLENSKEIVNETAWAGPIDNNLKELTCGFDDNFVEIWSQVSPGFSPGRVLSRDANDFTFGVDEEEDPVFKTVSVTAEEDDLWSTLPEAVLANQNEQLQYLQNKLTAMREQMGELAKDGPQLVFQNPDDYLRKDDGLSRWDNPVARRRINSDGQIELSRGPETVTAPRRRSYGDSYNRAKLLGDFSARKRALEVCEEEISGNPSRALDFDSSDCDSQTHGSASFPTKEGKVTEVPSPPVSEPPTDSEDSEPKNVSSSSPQFQESDKSDLNCDLSEVVGDSTSDNKESLPSDDTATQCDSSTDKSEQQLNNRETVLPKAELNENNVFQGSEKKRSPGRENAIVDEHAEQLLASETLANVEKTEVTSDSTPTETDTGDNDGAGNLSEEISEIGSNLSEIKTERKAEPARSDSFVTDATASDDCKSDEVESGESDVDKQLQSEDTVTFSTAPLDDRTVQPPLAVSPQVLLRDKASEDSPPSCRKSLPANFFSDVVLPVPPPRKNSPRKKSFKSSPAPAPPPHPPSSPSKRKAPTPPGSGATDSLPGSIVSTSRSERSNSDGSNLSSPRSKHRQHLSSHSSTSPSTSEKSTPATSPSAQRISRKTSPKRCAPQPLLIPSDGSCASSPGSRLSIQSLSRSPSKSPAPAPPGVSRSQSSPPQTAGSPTSSDEKEKGTTSDSLHPPPVPPPRLKRRSPKPKVSDTKSCHSASEDSGHSPDAQEVRKKHQSLPIEPFDLDDEFNAQHPSGSAENPGKEVLVDQTNPHNSQDADEEEDMEARQRRLELENMRADLFGYDKTPTGDFGDTKHNPNPNAQSAIEVIDIGGGKCDPQDFDNSQVFEQGEEVKVLSAMNRVVVNVGADEEIIRSVQATSSLDSLLTNSHRDISAPHKSKISLSFTDEIDDSNGYMYESRSPPRVDPAADPSKRLDQLIGLNDQKSQPYKTVLNISDSDIKKDSDVRTHGRLSPDQRSRIVLNLDSPQRTPETFRKNTGVTSPSTSTQIFLEEKVNLRTQPPFEDDGYKTDIYVSSSTGHDSSTYESASNYEESETSMSQDQGQRSEMAQLDDSDLSDNEANFQATFEPHVEPDEADSGITVASRVDPDDGDSGITLVSYYNTAPTGTSDSGKGTTPRSVGQGVVKERVSSGVVLNLSPPAYPQPATGGSGGPASLPQPATGGGAGPATLPQPATGGSDDLSPPVKLTRITRLESPPAPAQDTRLTLEVKAPSQRVIDIENVPCALPTTPPPPPLTPFTTSTPLHVEPAIVDGHNNLDQSVTGDKVDSWASTPPRPLSYNDNSPPVVRTGTTVYHSGGPGVGSRHRSNDNNSLDGTPVTTQQITVSQTDNDEVFIANPSSAGLPSVTTVNLGGQLNWHNGTATTTTTDTTAESTTISQPDLVTISTSADPNMDPITGLRKTGSVTPIDKAMRFVATTEPTFRMKKKQDPEIGKELENERATLMDSMRIRRKKLDAWVPGVDPVDTGSQYKTESEIKYEERKKRHDSSDQNEDNRREKPPDVIPTHVIKIRGKKQADIDSRSINQETTKKHWEQQFASCEVTLFPRPQEPGRKSVSKSDISEFKSEVETESIGDLNSVKRQWEQKAVELQKEKEERDRRMTSSKSFDNLSVSKSYDAGFLPSSKSYDSLKTVSDPRHMNNNHIYSTPYGEVDAVDNSSEQYESAIDREIRLAQEREDELRRDHEARLSKAVLHSDDEIEKETVATSKFSHQTAAPTAVDVEITRSTVRSPSPVDSGAQSPPPLSLETRGLILDDRLKKESIIEKEIREQQEKEQNLRYEGKLRNLANSNKEHEQSEYERQEKEQERINAHESIVEREIRLQREREQDLQRLRHIVYKQPIHQATTDHTTLSTPKADFVEDTPRTPEVFDEPEPLPLSTEVVPDKPAFHSEPTVASQELVEPSRTSSRLSTLSPTHPRDMANPVPYAEAISTYAHPGESMIARELREQKEREEELHRRWREELGLESPLKPCEPDTPYNMPDPVQPRMQVNKGSTYQRELKPYKDVTAQILSPHGGGGVGVRRTSIDSESSSRSTASNTADAQQQQPVPSRHKVQPFKMEDDEREVYQYVPQYETPIEREIRIAREREEEFRQMKGIVTVSADKTKDVEMKQAPPAPRPQALYRRTEEVGPEMSTMKRLAHSRLQQEIQIEKERELDLQRAGHISTTSEDRKGESHRYVEIIPKDSSPVAPVTVKTPTTPKTPTYVKSPLTVPPSQPAPVTPTTPEPEPPAVKPVQNGSITNGTAVKTQPAAEPLMARRVTKSQVDGGRRHMAEFKIEKELQEMREREEELRVTTVTSFGRNQREILSHRLTVPSDVHTTTTNGTANGGGATSPQPDEVRHRPRVGAPGDQLTKGPRRKSTLAEEWERKISGNASEH